MKLFSFWWNFTNRHAYLILMSVFIVWCALGVFPLACYKTDSLQLILGCDYAYSHGLEFPPVISYAYYMQPLTIIMVVALKHLIAGRHDHAHPSRTSACAQPRPGAVDRKSVV